MTVTLARAVPVSILLSALVLTACASTSAPTPAPTPEPAPTVGARPPAYLAVSQFRDCLATRMVGSYTAWCLPAARPDRCPVASWSQLQAFTAQDRVPNCPT